MFNLFWYYVHLKFYYRNKWIVLTKLSGFGTFKQKHSFQKQMTYLKFNNFDNLEFCGTADSVVARFKIEWNWQILNNLFLLHTAYSILILLSGKLQNMHRCALCHGIFTCAFLATSLLLLRSENITLSTSLFLVHGSLVIYICGYLIDEGFSLEYFWKMFTRINLFFKTFSFSDREKIST